MRNPVARNLGTPCNSHAIAECRQIFEETRKRPNARRPADDPQMWVDIQPSRLGLLGFSKQCLE